MKKQKKKYLSFLTDFQDLKEGFHKLEDLLKELSNNFEKVYIINTGNLELPQKKILMKVCSKKCINLLTLFFLIQKTLENLTNF